MRIYYFGTKADDHRIMETPGQLHDLQALVGGHIETVYLAEFMQFGIILLANEEGLLKGLDINWNLYPYFLVGPVIAVSYNDEDFISLDDMQIEYIREWIKNN